MYSRNDYRYYLERQLLVSDDYLAHYGVMGMKWRVRHDERRANLVSRRESNDAKIAKYQNKLNTVGAQKRAAKAAKYQHKVDKLQRKASKAQKRLAQGKSISKGQMKKLAKYETYKSKVAKNSVKNDKYQMKISKLQAKNAKIDKKITKMDRPSSAGARAYQKGLNKLDQKRVNSLYDTKVKSGKGLEKAKTRLASTTKELAATKKDAASRGYDVSSKERKRTAHPGRQVAAIGTFGALPGAGITLLEDTYAQRQYGQSRYGIEGNKYSVKKPKKKR